MIYVNNDDSWCPNETFVGTRKEAQELINQTGWKGLEAKRLTGDFIGDSIRINDDDAAELRSAAQSYRQEFGNAKLCGEWTANCDQVPIYGWDVVHEVIGYYLKNLDRGNK